MKTIKIENMKKTRAKRYLFFAGILILLCALMLYNAISKNNFYKNGEKVVIAGTVEGLEGSFVEIEEYPSIEHLSEDEKFMELVNFVDSLNMKHGTDYSCKKIYMLYTQNKERTK